MPDLPTNPTPDQLAQYYARGGLGAILDTDGFHAALRAEAASDAKLLAADSRLTTGTPQKKTPARALPFHYWTDQDPEMALRVTQLTGDCVAWAITQAIDITRCHHAAAGIPIPYRHRQAQALLYAERGHLGPGASIARLVRASLDHGILYETTYDGWDFTYYPDYVGISIRNGRTGLPEDLRARARPNRPQTAHLIKSIADAKIHLSAGRALAAASMIGVTNHGGHKGTPWLSTTAGRWAHAMTIIGYDDERADVGETVFLWAQTWGDWNRLPTWPEEWGDRPQGAFALTATDTAKALAYDATYAFEDFTSPDAPPPPTGCLLAPLTSILGAG